MTNGDEASELVRMMLHGGEVVLRLGGSALKNTIAFLMAMRQNNKIVYGKKSLSKLMKNFKDLRTFNMSYKQYQAFKKHSKGYKIPFAAIGSKKEKKGDVDLFLPQGNIEQANLVFAKIGYVPPAQNEKQEQARPEDKKKERQPTQSSRDSKAKSTTREASSSSRTQTSRENQQKPSVEGKLLQFHKQIKAQQATKPKARARARARGPKR